MKVMEKFKYSVSMEVTEEQFKSELKEALLNLGSEVQDEWNNEVLNMLERRDEAKLFVHRYRKGKVELHTHTCQPDYYVDGFNPRLFLAIASVTSREDIVRGDLVKVVENHKGDGGLEQLRTFDHMILKHQHCYKYMLIGGLVVWSIRKPTLEELIRDTEPYRPVEVTKPTEVPFNLNPEDARKIIDIACVQWKRKLAQLWGANILLELPSIVEKDFITKMREAATTTQKPILDQIFGSDKPVPPLGTICWCWQKDPSRRSLRVANGNGRFFLGGYDQGGTSADWLHFEEVKIK